MVRSVRGQVGAHVASHVVLVPVKEHVNVMIQLLRMVVFIVLDLKNKLVIVFRNIVQIMVSVFSVIWIYMTCLKTVIFILQQRDLSKPLLS